MCAREDSVSRCVRSCYTDVHQPRVSEKPPQMCLHEDFPGFTTLSDMRRFFLEVPTFAADKPSRQLPNRMKLHLWLVKGLLSETLGFWNLAPPCNTSTERAVQLIQKSMHACLGSFWTAFALACCVFKPRSASIQMLGLNTPSFSQTNYASHIESISQLYGVTLKDVTLVHCAIGKVSFSRTVVSRLYGVMSTIASPVLIHFSWATIYHSGDDFKTVSTWELENKEITHPSVQVQIRSSTALFYFTHAEWTEGCTVSIRRPQPL